MQQLCAVLDMPQVNPVDKLHEFKSTLLACAKDMFPSVAPAPACPDWAMLTYPDGTTVRVQVSPQTTVIELFQAELALSQDATTDQWIDAATGLPLDYYTKVAGLNILVQGTRHAVARSSTDAVPVANPAVPIPLDFGDLDFSPDTAARPMDLSGALHDQHVPPPVVHDSSAVPPMSVSPGVAVDVDASSAPVMDTLIGLRHLTGFQLAALIPPLVTSHETCRMYRQATVPMSSRLAVLANEGIAMGDDELSLHLSACVQLSGRQDVQFLDPLLATGWLQGGYPQIVQDWIQQFPDLACIVTAVHVCEHWMPVIWSKGMSEVQVMMWEHVGVDVDCLNPLHGLISSAWGMPRFTVACSRRSFAQGRCGAAAIAFVSHRLLGHDLPCSESALESLHQDLKGSFADACRSAPALTKPWCWGLGVVDVIGLTAELLVKHGVPAAQATLRAKLVVQSLGKTEVQQALTGTAPWKSLKALATMQTPVVQMVLPDEQAQFSAAKPTTKPKKAPPAKKLAPVRPAELDPAKLLLEKGGFRCSNDDPLSQIQFASVGPLACGVALVSYMDALPFLQSGQTLTNHGLALLVLNAPAEFQTSLSWSTVRFAARCCVNQEPMLASGHLVQLGRSPVYQFLAKDIPSVPTVEVACAQISVYYDQWEGDWEEFATRPVKHVLSVLSCLQTCRKGPTCQCSSWHPAEDQTHDAVLDVFRRQFFNDANRPVKWDKASHFAVLVRYVKGLETTVLCASGQHGVYVEPKTEDALRSHADFQVVWLPQMDFNTVTHKAKCEVDSMGVVRSGKRYGIRVHVQHFQRVFTNTKPDAVFLAPGSRLVFQCGPWPFGSDRKSIARILKSSGWECRPLQPSQHVPGGLMWTIQSVTEPPMNVIAMQHGQVLITCQDAKTTMPEPDAKVVGHAKTVELCRPAEASNADPWLTSDPWSKAIAHAPAPPVGPPAQHVLHELEQRIEQSVLAKLPATERMEVDDQDQRLQQLEAQLQQLATRQTSLETTVTEHHQQNAAQVQSLQQQMKVQLDMQTQQMQHMLTDQMARIETILAKKPRTE